MLSKPRILRLALGVEDFDSIERGEKKEILRPMNVHWNILLTERDYEQVILRCGIIGRVMVIPYYGYEIKKVSQADWEAPVRMFAIKMEGE